MEKITKSYVEKIYRGLSKSESFIEEISERNPMKVENDGFIQGFRFYDIVDKEKLNYSNWIYFGKRLTLEEFKDIYGNNPAGKALICYMEGNGYQSVCHTQIGSFLPMKNNDMTFDEVALKQKNILRLKK